MIPFEYGTENISNVFIVYDSDSLTNNKDIYIKLFPDWICPNSNTINISNIPGDDIKPLATSIDDSVTIFWEHKENNSIQIWWAKDYFDPPDPTCTNNKLPVNLSLVKNYPNPFNPSTTIEYNLKIPAFVNIKIFNNLGEEIIDLTNDMKKAGKHSVYWNGKNTQNKDVTSGTYYYRIKVNNKFFYGKMLLVR
jgi:hypothetical protein